MRPAEDWKAGAALISKSEARRISYYSAVHRCLVQLPLRNYRCAAAISVWRIEWHGASGCFKTSWATRPLVSHEVRNNGEQIREKRHQLQKEGRKNYICSSQCQAD